MSPAKSLTYSFDLSEEKIYQDQVVLLVSSSEDRDEMSLKRHLSHIEVIMYYDFSPAKETEPLSLPTSATMSTVCTTVRCPKSECAIKHHEVKY